MDSVNSRFDIRRCVIFTTLRPCSPACVLNFDAMPDPGLADLKRRRRVASRALLADARVTVASPDQRERPPQFSEKRRNLEREPAVSVPVLAGQVEPEPESCCARLLRSISCKVDATVSLR